MELSKKVRIKITIFLNPWICYLFYFSFRFKQVLQTREDGVIIVSRENGTSVVEYLDGTRITMATKTRVDHMINQETGESREVEVQYEEVTVCVQSIRHSLIKKQNLFQYIQLFGYAIVSTMKY